MEIQMSTMRQVAARAGVSAKTVSRVMHNDRYVSDEVRRRVEQAIQELQYVPNTLARSFRSGRDAAIGICVPDISDPFFATVTQAAERIARARHTAVFVTSLGNDPADERPGVEALLGRQVAGLISTPISADQSYLKPWQSRTAMVFIDRPPARIRADSVVEDDHGGARMATEHLIEHGHRRIGFIGDVLSVATTARRLEGYRAALAGGGIDEDPRLVALGARSPGEAGAAARQLLADPDPVTALFSSNALCSIAVVPALQAIGRSDIALISFGDFPLADALDPALSVVDQDPNSLGQVAANRLFERMDHPNKRLKRELVLPVALVLRASCCSPADRLVGHAPARPA
jgi:LacI family transcriptional regulator